MPVANTPFNWGQNLVPSNITEDVNQGQQAQALAGVQGEYGVKQAQIAANASMYPATLAQQRFATVFPWLTSTFNSAKNAYGTGANGTGGPQISVGGVYNPQQIQQQVNASNAQTDQATASQNRNSQNQLAGRGFGSNSPLLQSLQGQNFASGLGTKTQAEQQLRTTAAQQNAQQTLATQQAAAQQYTQQRGQSLQAQSALLSALAGIA